jgi:hypothetical protein
MLVLGCSLQMSDFCHRWAKWWHCAVAPACTVARDSLMDVVHPHLLCPDPLSLMHATAAIPLPCSSRFTCNQHDNYGYGHNKLGRHTFTQVMGECNWEFWPYAAASSSSKLPCSHQPTFGCPKFVDRHPPASARESPDLSNKNSSMNKVHTRLCSPRQAAVEHPHLRRL